MTTMHPMLFVHRMLSSLVRFDRPAFMLIPMSVAAIYATVASSMLNSSGNGSMLYIAVLLDLAVSILALLTVLRIGIKSLFSSSVLRIGIKSLFSSSVSYDADGDEPTKPARVNGSAPWGRKSIPDQLPLPTGRSRLSLSGENTLEDLRIALRRTEEKILERNLDPALEKILMKLALALEPHIKAGYRVTSIEVRISPPPKDFQTNQAKGRGEEAIPVTPKSK